MLRPLRLLGSALICASTVALCAGPSSAQVGTGLLDPNVATETQLSELPGVDATVRAAWLEARPFADAPAFEAFLSAQGLAEETRSALYAQAFLHVDLNHAPASTLRLIPGVGKRMAHEFEEYRPWKSWAQFEREIGKYVDKPEVARLKRYVFIPLRINSASEADFMTIPGVGKRMAHEFEEYRPWVSRAQFEREIGKYVEAPEVARLWRYMSLD